MPKKPPARKKSPARKPLRIERLAPQLATLVDAAPEGDEWLHETKFDGYRMICAIDGGRATLKSRNDIEWTRRFAEIAEAAARLPVKQAVLDGEVVSLDAHGLSSFQALQNVLRDGRTGQLVYYVFDLLWLDGRTVALQPLEERKAILSKIVRERNRGRIRYSDHVVGRGSAMYEQACKAGLEGIISKRRDRPYRAGRSDEWLKTKCLKRQEFVIGGYTKPEGSRVGFGALHVGYYTASGKTGGGKLVYAGRVGTGFSNAALRELTRKLQQLRQPASPFSDFTSTNADARDATWVRPKLVGEVRFTEWTNDGRLRHPSFEGLRLDKSPAEVKRELPRRVR
jgi:bifunctional non-homologous end joining protein LigD